MMRRAPSAPRLVHARGICLLVLALPFFPGCGEDPKPTPKVPVEKLSGGPGVEEPGEGTGDLDPIPAGPSVSGPALESEPNDDRDTASSLPINGAIRGALVLGDVLTPAVGGAAVLIFAGIWLVARRPRPGATPIPRPEASR